MPDRPIVILDAPSNLGLRPPEPGAVPGCYKMPWALRDRKLLSALGAVDGGALVPPRYLAAWQPGDSVRNAEAIASYSIALADRVGSIIESGALTLVLGGDCSILIGNALALKRRGRCGLVFLDAHSDFRHLRNAPAVGAAAGEDLALVTGRGDPRLTNLENLGPYIYDEYVLLVGVREDDEYLPELDRLGIGLITSSGLKELGVQEAAARTLAVAEGAPQGFWVHLDLDVLDEIEMPAVDSPAPGGLSFAELTELLKPLVRSPACLGLELTIFDPDLDPAGNYADQVMDCLTAVFQGG